MALFGRKKAAETKVEEANVEVVAKKAKATKATTKTTAKKTTKKEAEVETTKAVKAVEATEKKVEAKSAYGYRITEKATTLADKNVYVLNVPKTINKTNLKKDLETTHKVTVLSINIVNTPKKVKIYRGKFGMRGGGKKAYITLKAGDSIVL